MSEEAGPPRMPDKPLSLQDQFLNYRGRIRHTLGNEMERAIYDGAVGEYVEDPDHKGEYKLEPQWKDEFQDGDNAYLRPWFDESNPNFTRDPQSNRSFLQGVQQRRQAVPSARPVVLNCGGQLLPQRPVRAGDRGHLGSGDLGEHLAASGSGLSQGGVRPGQDVA